MLIRCGNEMVFENTFCPEFKGGYSNQKEFLNKRPVTNVIYSKVNRIQTSQPDTNIDFSPKIKSSTKQTNFFPNTTADEKDIIKQGAGNVLNIIAQLPAKELNKLLGTTKTVIDDPKMTKYAKISDLAYSYGFKDNEKVGTLLEDLPSGFEIDPQLSGRNSVTLVNPNTKEAIIGYRGSDTQFKNISTLIDNPERVKNIEDWYINALTMTGNQHETNRYKEAQNRFNSVKEKYPGYELSVTGHSNGGGQSNFISEKNNVKGYHFNPAINPLQKTAGKNTKESIVYATEGDLVSLPSRIKPNNKSTYKVEHITPKVGTESNFTDLHSIEQFHTPRSTTSERVSLGRARLGLGLGLSGALGEYLTYYQPAKTKTERNVRMTTTAAETLLLPEAVIGPRDIIGFIGPDLDVSIETKNKIRKQLGIHPIKERKLNKVPVYDPLTERIRKWTRRSRQEKQLLDDNKLVETKIEGAPLKSGRYTVYESGKPGKLVEVP